MNFRRAEAMNVHIRKMRFDVAEQFLVPLQFKSRMQTALHQNLIATQSDSLFDFG